MPPLILHSSNKNIDSCAKFCPTSTSYPVLTLILIGKREGIHKSLSHPKILCSHLKTVPRERHGYRVE